MCTQIYVFLDPEQLESHNYGFNHESWYKSWNIIIIFLQKIVLKIIFINIFFQIQQTRFVYNCARNQKSFLIVPWSRGGENRFVHPPLYSWATKKCRRKKRWVRTSFVVGRKKDVVCLLSLTQLMPSWEGQVQLWVNCLHSVSILYLQKTYTLYIYTIHINYIHLHYCWHK